MTTPVKRCIDCVHCYVPWRPTGMGAIQDVSLASCKRTDVIDGSGRNAVPCHIERAIGNRCGSGAQHFEAKPVRVPKPKRRWWWWL